MMSVAATETSYLDINVGGVKWVEVVLEDLHSGCF